MPTVCKVTTPDSEVICDDSPPPCSWRCGSINPVTSLRMRCGHQRCTTQKERGGSQLHPERRRERQHQPTEREGRLHHFTRCDGAKQHHPQGVAFSPPLHLWVVLRFSLLLFLPSKGWAPFLGRPTPRPRRKANPNPIRSFFREVLLFHVSSFGWCSRSPLPLWVALSSLLWWILKLGSTTTYRIRTIAHDICCRVHTCRHGERIQTTESHP